MPIGPLKAEGNATYKSGVVPAFYMSGIQSKNSLANEINVAEYTFNIATIFTGVGNLAKLRYLKHATKAKKYIRIGLGLTEISSTAVDLMLKLNDDCDGSEFCQELQNYLFYVQLVSLGFDIGGAGILGDAADKVLQAAKKSNKTLEKQVKNSFEKVSKANNAGGLVQFAKIRNYLGHGKIKAYLNNQELQNIENILKAAHTDVLKQIDGFDLDDFAELARGYKDNATAFSNSLKSLEAFSGDHGWLKFWTLTPKLKNSLNTIADLKSANKLDDVGDATDIQLSSIHSYTANGDFVNVPYRYNANWFGNYNTRAVKHINEGLNALRKVTSRAYKGRTFSGKTFSKADFDSKFVGKNNTLHEYSGYMSTSKLESVAEGFIELTKKWATGKSEKVAVIQRVTSRNGVYIDDISDWGKNLGVKNHPSPPTNPKVQVQEEVLLNSQKLRQTSEPIPVMENGVHKTIDGMKVYYVDLIEVL